MSNVPVSRVNPKHLDPFDNDTKEAYGDAIWMDEKGRYYYENEEYIYEDEFHYYKVDFNDSGRANVYMEYNDDSDIDLYVFDRDGVMLSKDNSNRSNHRLCHSIDMVEDENYLIGIKANSIDGRYSKYTLKAKLYRYEDDYEDMLWENNIDEDSYATGPWSDYRRFKFRDWGSRRLERKDEGTDVTHLQRILYKIEYLREKYISGIFCKETEDELGDFQRDIGIPRTEEVDDLTLEELEEAVWREYKGLGAVPDPYEYLWEIVRQWWPGSVIRFIKKYKIEDILKDEKDFIIKMGNKYDVPPAIIAGIIVREQITQSFPDEVVLPDTLIRKRGHSYGLGAIFPATAQKAWTEINPLGLHKYGVHRDDKTQIALALKENDYFNIETIAVVLRYYAKIKYNENDFSNLSTRELRTTIGRYNASDKLRERQQSYGRSILELSRATRMMGY